MREIVCIKNKIAAQRAPQFLQKNWSKRYSACSDVASLKGFEPPTYRLGGGRSIQLSYRDKKQS